MDKQKKLMGPQWENLRLWVSAEERKRRRRFASLKPRAKAKVVLARTK